MISIIEFIVIFFIALSTNKYPGTYKGTSTVSIIYRILRDVSFQLCIVALILVLKDEPFLPYPLVWSLYALCIFFNYQYLQRNNEFIEKKGKYFLLSAGTVICSTILFITAISLFFWESKIYTSVIVCIIALISVGFSIYFNRKNKEYQNNK